MPYFKKKSQKSNFTNILVVSNTGLGDTILGSPAIKSLRKSFPELQITFLINKSMYPLYKDFKYVDDFILFSTGIINQLKIIKQIRKRKIDTIFLLHSNGPEDIFFSILGGASTILKMTDDAHHPYRNIFLNASNTKHQHVIEKKLDLVRLYEPSILDTKMEISSYYKNRKIEKLSINTHTIIIGFQVGAQDSYKIWPIEKFIALAQKLDKTFQIQIVLLGASALEGKLTEKFVKEVNAKQEIINICCKTSIESLPTYIENLDLLITNDTGTLHLAIALKVKTISLFGPTDSKIYGPYQDLDLHTVIQKDGNFVNDRPKKKRTQEGIDLIQVDEVFSCAREIMEEYK